jgi:hypothetical protein
VTRFTRPESLPLLEVDAIHISDNRMAAAHFRSTSCIISTDMTGYSNIDTCRYTEQRPVVCFLTCQRHRFALYHMPCNVWVYTCTQPTFHRRRSSSWGECSHPSSSQRCARSFKHLSSREEQHDHTLNRPARMARARGMRSAIDKSLCELGRFDLQGSWRMHLQVLFKFVHLGVDSTIDGPIQCGGHTLLAEELVDLCDRYGLVPRGNRRVWTGIPWFT